MAKSSAFNKRGGEAPIPRGAARMLDKSNTALGILKKKKQGNSSIPPRMGKGRMPAGSMNG